VTAIPISRIIAEDDRLRRRLATTSTGSVAEILTLLRASLVAKSYATVDATGSLLKDIEPSVWEMHGFANHGEGHWKARPWLPSWLDHYGNPPDEPLNRSLVRRPNWSLPADQFYALATLHREYLSGGQRQAVRAAATALPGDTITVVLPTGSGKTEVVLTRAIRERPRQTLIITPTVSLALDLERRVQTMVGETRSLAYHGDIASEQKSAMVDAIRSGEQWITITSPEAACTVLSRALESAASEGRLGLIAIDEAHMVAEWGDDFRPAFQTLAGLRRTLLRVSPAWGQPITLLLTATLDQYGLDTLRRLFPGTRQVLISSQATRPEPAWWNRQVSSEEEKRKRLLELCRQLPRPLLIYTTLHTSARSTNVHTVVKWLSNAGFTSVGAITSGVDSGARARVVRDIRLQGSETEDIDIVVATSAFGLGIDIPNIKAVIHLCVPESLDRLYQEVGRGGRDGTASGSFVIWTEADREVAADMASARLIGDELAWQRWQKMRLGESANGLLQVDLTSAHTDVRYPWSGANQYWNLQTLNTMDRAGMIELEWPIPGSVPLDLSEDELQDIFASRGATTAVRVLQGDLNEQRFRQRFRMARESMQSSAAASVSSAIAVLENLDECLNGFLSDHYRLSSSRDVFPVALQCGGCSHCRAIGARPTHSSTPVLARQSRGLSSKASGALTAFSQHNRICIWRDDPSAAAEQELVDRLVLNGVRCLTSVGTFSPLPRPTTQAWWVETVAEWQPYEEGVSTPMLVRLSSSDVQRRDVQLLLGRNPRRNLTIVLVDKDCPDPSDERLYLRESFGAAFSVDQILRSL